MVWPRTQRMPRAPSLWLSTVSAATSPARPLSIGALLGGDRRLGGAVEPGGDDRRRLTPEQRQYFLHAVVHIEERRRIECLGERIDALVDRAGLGQIVGPH